jgi:hypothetical protein
MSIWFTEFDGTEIIFQFYDKELPEAIPRPMSTKTNHIEYAGGHQTNQIIGVYRGNIEWQGQFFGSYIKDGKTITAADRVKEFQTLLGRPLRVGFHARSQEKDGSAPGRSNKDSNNYSGGFEGTYIIKDFVPTQFNYFHVDFTILLQPHDRQEKIKPRATVSVKINVEAGKAAAKKLVSVKPRHHVVAKAKPRAVAATKTFGRMYGKSPGGEGATLNREDVRVGK